MEVDLIPPTPGVEMDPEVIDLMRLVFRADRDERASARELLEHPLITGGKNILPYRVVLESHIG